MGRAKLRPATEEPPDEELPEQPELYDDEPPSRVVTTVDVPRSSPPSDGLALYPKLPAALVRAAAALRVERLAPSTHTGFLPQQPPNTSPEDLRRMFGGRLYRLQLVNGLGHIMANTTRTIEFDEEPRRGDAGTKATSGPVDVETIVRRVVDPLKEELERAKANAKLEMEAERARRQMEAEEREAKSKRDLAESDARHKRELEAIETRARLDAERDRQRHELDMKREEQRAAAALASQREMVHMVVQTGQQNVTLLVETMKSQRSESGGIEQLASMAELVSTLRGGDDKTSMIREASNALNNFAKLAESDTRGVVRVAPRAGLPARQGAPTATSKPVASNPSPAPTATPQGPAEGLPALDVARLRAAEAKVLKGWLSQGYDPQKILDDLASGELVLVPASELEDDEGDAQPADGAAPEGAATPAAAPTAPAAPTANGGAS